METEVSYYIRCNVQSLLNKKTWRGEERGEGSGLTHGRRSPLKPTLRIILSSPFREKDREKQ